MFNPLTGLTLWIFWMLSGFFLHTLVLLICIYLTCSHKLTNGQLCLPLDIKVKISKRIKLQTYSFIRFYSDDVTAWTPSPYIIFWCYNGRKTPEIFVHKYWSLYPRHPCPFTYLYLSIFVTMLFCFVLDSVEKGSYNLIRFTAVQVRCYYVLALLSVERSFLAYLFCL